MPALGAVDVAIDARELRRVHHRPAVEIHLRRADAHFARTRRRHRPTNSVVDLLLHQQAAAGGARLAGVLDDRADDDRHARVRGRRRRTRSAATCRPAPARTSPRCFAAACWTSVPTSFEPVNVMKSMPGCAASAAPASSPCPVTMLSAPSGSPALRRDLREAQRRQAGVLGGLQHRGVAHRERGCDRAAEHLRRIVPRDDVRGDAERLAQQRHRVARRGTGSPALHLVGGAAVELEVARQHLMSLRAVVIGLPVSRASIRASSSAWWRPFEVQRRDCGRCPIVRLRVCPESRTDA